MDQGWAAIIAAAAAGIVGALTGVTVGRRQTTDQADVEHQQWLRGQRQDAYVHLLDAWDEAVTRLERIAEDWEDLGLRLDNQGNSDAFQEVIQQRAEEARQVMVKPLDRVMLLGPEGVDRAAARLASSFGDAQAWLGRQADPDEQPEDWVQWERLLRIVYDVRGSFVEATKNEMRRAPRPGRQPGRVFRGPARWRSLGRGR